MLSREISNAQGMPGGEGGMLMFLFDTNQVMALPHIFSTKISIFV